MSFIAVDFNRIQFAVSHYAKDMIILDESIDEVSSFNKPAALCSTLTRVK